MNLKIPVSPNLDLWKRFRISFCYEFIEKRQSYQGTLGLFGSFGPLRLYVQREREYFLYIWLQERCVNICWKSWNKRRRSVWERGVTRKCYDSRDCWEILNTPTPNALMVQRFDLLKGLHLIAQLGKTRVYILEEKLEMDASQTVNGLKCCF